MRTEIVEACVRIVREQHRASQAVQPVSRVIREMGLLLDHLRMVMHGKEDCLGVIGKFHMETTNRLLRIRREPREPSDLRIERDANHQRYTLTLIKLESQRRDVMTGFDPEIRSIERQLAELLSEYELLTSDHGSA